MTAVSTPSYLPWIALPVVRTQMPAKPKALQAGASLVDVTMFRAVDGLRKILGAITRSLTALGNSANAYFAQLSATLALDRAAHSMAHAVGIAPRFAFPFTPFSNPFSSVAGFQPLTTTNFTTAILENSFATMANTFSLMANTLGFWAVRH